MTIIAQSELARFAPHGTAVIADAVVENADAVFPKWNITTRERVWMFMAMASVESRGFSALFEDLNYSAERLVQVWPTRFPTLDAAQPYAHNSVALANKVYGGRLGNTEPNDAYLLRGQGILQLTGRDNIGRLAKALDVSVDQCRALLTAPATMLECAAATFVTWGCLPYADKGDVEGCTRVINGGLNGLADRKTAYALAKQVWPTLRAPTLLNAPVVSVNAIPPPPPVAAAVQPPAPTTMPPKLSWWQQIVVALTFKKAA